MDLWWTLVVAVAAHLGPEDRWARELTRLDLVRAAALAEAEPTALADVYVPGAQADDAELIERYAERGARVVGAVLLVETADVVRADDDRVVLDVVDRLGPARVVWHDGRSRALPRDRSTRREVVLVATDAGWRIASSRVTPP